MNAPTQTPAESMNTSEIEAELAALKDAENHDYAEQGRRDFKSELEQATPDRAEEIHAEQVLYSGRKRRRAARCEALEKALAALKAADVSDTLDSMVEAHGEALAAAQSALNSIDLEALATLEQQVSDYLAAEAIVRNHACDAANIAAGAGCKAPSLTSPHAPELVAICELFQRLKAQVTSSEQRLPHDQWRLGVPSVEIQRAGSK